MSRKKKFFLAVVNDDREAIYSFLTEGGFSADTATADNYTPLMIASIKGFADLARLLVEHGANVNAREPEGFTPFLYAVKNGHKDIASILLERGADPNVCDKTGRSALFFAIERGLSDMVRFLLGKGVSTGGVEAATGRTPLMLAAEKESVDILLSLLMHAEPGALSAFDNEGNTALFIAAKKGNADAFRVLADNGSDIRARNHLGQTPLIVAAAAGSVGSVRFLLEHDVDANETDDTGKTALMYAVDSGATEVLDVLFDYGARGVWRDDIGSTAIHYASLAGKAECVARLIEEGVSVNARNDYEHTPLHYAAREGYEVIVARLVSAHAHLNARDNYGKTALMYASERGHKDIVSFLLEQGADASLRSMYGFTALMYALELKQNEIATTLRSFGSSLPAPRDFRFHTALSREDLLARITVRSGHAKDEATIRNLDVRVKDVLALFAKHFNETYVLEEYPMLTEEDVKASLLYASDAFEHTHTFGANDNGRADAIENIQNALAQIESYITEERARTPLTPVGGQQQGVSHDVDDEAETTERIAIKVFE